MIPIVPVPQMPGICVDCYSRDRANGYTFDPVPAFVPRMLCANARMAPQTWSA